MEIVDLIRRCVRIVYIARKPTGDEFQKVAKVTALGMIAFGVIGLVISFILAEF